MQKSQYKNLSWFRHRSLEKISQEEFITAWNISAGEFRGLCICTCTCGRVRGIST